MLLQKILKKLQGEAFINSVVKIQLEKASAFEPYTIKPDIKLNE